MVIEISRRQADRLGSVEKAIARGWFTIWSAERIKKAFNYGNGSKSDFLRYKTDNNKYCIFKDLSESEIDAILNNLSGV